MKIKELLQSQDKSANTIISSLKLGRPELGTDIVKAKDQLDPFKHEIFNPVTRPDKIVKVDPSEASQDENVVNVTGSNGSQSGNRIERVARIALAIQKLIVKRAVSFIFGNPVTLDAQPENENQKSVLKAIKRVMYDIKEKSFNRKVARNLFSGTEVAEIWYPVEDQNNSYGFSSKFKLRCGIFSPLLGDLLYPYFDETGDMVAFSREFYITKEGVKKTFFETYTDEAHYLWEQSSEGFTIVEGYPKTISIKKIPVIYGVQEQVEWADVQGLIDRLEKLLSNFADTNDYHASPKIFVQGKIEGFAKKGESGAILEGDAGSTAEYLSWENAPESVKLEIETLLRMIYTITQTPDISFEAVKGIGAISGIALKLLFMDAHLKVADHQEVFDEYLQRRINLIKAYIGEFNKALKPEADNLIIEPIITPYMIKDEAAELKIWSDANGGEAVISQKASFAKAGLTSDPDADYLQYQDEQSGKNTFSLNEPTLPA
jgi:SPP1 family phage portal protein